MNLENFDRQREDYLSELEAAKTDSQELAEVLTEYDFDDSIVNEFNRISRRFQSLKQEFLALKKTTTMRLTENG